MKMRSLAAALATALLCLGACSAAPGASEEAPGAVSQAIQKSDPRKIYVHLMPWFETPGFHWDMVGRHYNPQIGPYHSGDYKVIEYQLLLMKYAGIDGVIIDWPGRSTMFQDLPANAENTDQIIDQTAKFGMEFAVCYEDQYAPDANDAVNSMHYVRDHYFNRPNQIKINGAPALFVFGPQKIGAGDWPNVLSATGTDPMFFTLWYNTNAGGVRDGTFAWLYSDALTGIRNYYDRPDQGTKVPVLYPGFNAAYPNGAPGWGIAYDVEGDTFTATYNASKGVGDAVQIATWNDYTEGTMIEPSNELGYKSLTTLQKLLGVPYGQAELEIVRQLFDKRKANDPKADAASTALINFDVASACAQLGCNAPNRPPGTGGQTGSGGTPPSGGGAVSMGGAPGSSGQGSGGAPVAGTSPGSGGTSAGTTSSDAGSASSDSHDSGGCHVGAARHPSRGPLFLLASCVLGIALRRQRRGNLVAA